MSKISFYSADRSVPLKKRNPIKRLLATTVLTEHFLVGTISYVFCSDAYLLKMNRRFLDHDTYTDILTFPVSASGKTLSAEIYISTDRIKENAKQYGETYENELLRVMIHGVLHLCGYKDKTTPQKKRMLAAENYYLNLYRQYFT